MKTTTSTKKKQNTINRLFRFHKENMGGQHIHDKL